MKKIIFYFFLAGISALIISSCKKKSASSLLEFNLEKGKSYEYELIMDLDQNVMGQNSKISVTGGYIIKVTDQDGKFKTLSGQYKNYKMYMKMMGVEIDVDTDKPSPLVSEEELNNDPAKMMNRIFSGIVGKPFTIKMDNEGKVLEVNGFTGIIESIVDSARLSEDMKQQMRASLNDQFNEQTIKDQFSQVFNIFPGKAVAVGDSWQKTYITGGRMAANNTTDFIVKKIENGIITIETKTTIVPLPASDIAVSGNQTGTMTIDSKTGLMLNGEFDVKMNTKMQEIIVETKGKGKVKGRAL